MSLKEDILNGTTEFGRWNNIHQAFDMVKGERKNYLWYAYHSDGLKVNSIDLDGLIEKITVVNTGFAEIARRNKALKNTFSKLQDLEDKSGVDISTEEVVNTIRDRRNDT